MACHSTKFILTQRSWTDSGRALQTKVKRPRFSAVACLEAMSDFSIVPFLSVLTRASAANTAVHQPPPIFKKHMLLSVPCDCHNYPRGYAENLVTFMHDVLSPCQTPTVNDRTHGLIACFLGKHWLIDDTRKVHNNIKIKKRTGEVVILTSKCSVTISAHVHPRSLALIKNSRSRPARCGR